MNGLWILRKSVLAGTLAVLAAAPVCLAQAANSGNAEFVLTANAKNGQPMTSLQQSDVSVSIKNRNAAITSWKPLTGNDAKLQLVFLFDESASSYLALQFPSLRKFIEALPSSAEVGIAYMANGRAVFTQPLTADHAKAGAAMRIPNSMPGVSGSPYFCLSDLVKKWPSAEKVRRVVFMVTNGEDPYYTQNDLQDPYLAAAITDAQRAGVLVYSIYFHDVGFRGTGRLGTLFGQNYLLRLSSDTGGFAYANTLTTPVSFDPYLKQFRTALDSQYMVGVAGQGSDLQRLKVKSKVKDVKISAPSLVNVAAGQ